MPSIAKVPVDVTGAIIARLASFSEISSLVGNRISPEIATGWKLPEQNCILVRPTGGPQLGNRDVGLAVARYDITCYAPGIVDADLLMRKVSGALAPTLASVMQFKQNNVKIYDILVEANTITGRTPDNWPFAWRPFIFKYFE